MSSSVVQKAINVLRGDRLFPVPQVLFFFCEMNWQGLGHRSLLTNFDRCYDSSCRGRR